MATERRLAARAWPDANLEIRLVGDGMTFEGYAAVFNSDSERLARWGVERIAPGAFTRSLSEDPDIRMFLNHNTDALLASTKAGTLRLSEDDYGLRVQADLPDTNHGRDLATLIKRGDVRSMSFGFEPVEFEPRTDGVDGYIHTEVRLAEVSPVTSWPAYTATTAAVRAIESADDFREAASRARSLEQQANRFAEFRNRGESLSATKRRELSEARDELLSILDRLPATSEELADNEVDGTRQWLRTLDPTNPADMADAAQTVAGVTDHVGRFWRTDHDPELTAMQPILQRVVAAMDKSETHNRQKANKMTDNSLGSLWTTYQERGGVAHLEIDFSPEFREVRALGSSGGSAIPTTFADQVVVYQRTASPMLDPNVVTLSTSNSGAAFVIPRLTADPSFGGTLTAEAAAITEADPTISSITLNPYKYAGITLWSAELGEDEVIEIQSLIAQSHGRQLGLNIGTELTTANGSSKPNGFINAATNGGTADKTFGGTATTFFDYGDLVDLWGSLSAPYRQVGVWQLSNAAFVKVQRFRDDNGNLAMLPGLMGGPPTLLGRPVYENPAMAAVASASKSVAFGDFKAYWVRRVAPLRVELSRDYKFNTDQVALKVVDRVDGDLIDTAAVAYMVSADT